MKTTTPISFTKRLAITFIVTLALAAVHKFSQDHAAPTNQPTVQATQSMLSP